MIDPSDAGYTAIVPALSGCVCQADTMEELWIKLRAAIEGWVESETERQLRAADERDELDPTAEVIEFEV
ncbi:MAG TPA: type II toxin-antitoxin system HicB family antitoxin [Gemmataceae bacterium]|nr:type II toxin-antitoxin system HicB family antitoxin [Gemmataceae bacterium]